MSGPGVWAGLADSAFLADVDERDRDPTRIFHTLVGGLAVGFVAAFAGWVVIMAPYTLLVGEGAQGFTGLGKVAAMLADPGAGGLPLTLLRLAVDTTTDGTFWLAFVALAAVVARHRLHAYVTAAVQIRWRLLAMGMALATLAMAPLIAADRLLDPGVSSLSVLAISPGAGGRVAYGLSAALLIPAAVAEELFFRGWLLRQAAAFTRRPAVLIALTAVVFSTLHFDSGLDGFLTITLMGVGFAYMTLRLGGIEFSAGAHAANNILVVLFIQPLGGRLAAAPTGVSGASLLEDGALIAGYILITEAVARLPHLRRWAGVRPEELSGPGAGAPRFS